MGKLVNEQNNQSFAIYLDNVENESGFRARLPSHISTIIRSALISISSKKIIIKATFNEEEQMSLYPNSYIISGAITEFHQTKKVIYIKLNLNPWNVKTNDYISGMNTEVSMSFYETRNGNKGFTIKSQAYNISGNTLENYDIHSMITIISRLAVIELIGKLGNYPYWNCIKGAKVNFELLNKKVDLELSKVNEQRIYIPKTK